MTFGDPRDTIVALSSAPGPGGRALVRLSGPSALKITLQCVHTTGPVPLQRRCHAGWAQLPGLAAKLPLDLYIWPGPRTYTGQEMVELHILSSPPLVELLISQLLDAGARAARPGEFTLRAFLAGKLDLTRAEAVLAVIEASSRGELTQALAQLAGGVAKPLQELRSDLLDLLADVEAGLDFAEEDIKFVQQGDLLKRLAKGLALITLLGKQLERRSIAAGPFRVVLAGLPNAGKSSLFNALAGRPDALVSPEPGTTRDYLVRRVELQGVGIELVDIAGWQRPEDMIDEQAQDLGREQAEKADLLLWCIPAGTTPGPEVEELLARRRNTAVAIATKCDLAKPANQFLATSARSGAGLPALRSLLAERARRHTLPALAPSLSRCRHHVEACLQHLRRAHASVLDEAPPELLALALREALEELGAMVGGRFIQTICSLVSLTGFA